ncbi:MAG: SpoIIE family protein phosphatase [candidate division KSB1 bacterium]|nr:SpoIIE family protein phosphatase [candidate division KSB1 bacterium]MDZ7272704.1 SpoIIE family protein phosphatase [candidate division KSB1 bacterium]MDZ7284273.1 SpoIIE family protein phosphatase [candidate division KSB1 bacterium]MDZ7297331.1 SpoIIE family protein phosphatase [candidate division KSB1 bacterium]MDZ7308399.1 SpoIIE family protein phosphatase [candidate division KSB1 bacterium]
MTKTLFQRLINLSLEEYEMFEQLPLRIRWQAACSLTLFYLSIIILLFLAFDRFLSGILPAGLPAVVYPVIFLLMLSDTVIIFHPHWRRYYSRLTLAISLVSAVLGAMIGISATPKHMLPEAKNSLLFGIGFVAIVAGIKCYGRVARAVFTEKSRIETEIKLAQRIQSQLLPVVEKSPPGCRLFGRTLPAQEVGGDYFEVVELPDQRLAVAIGDVAGHNVAAGLLMAITKSAFLTGLKYLSRPEKLMQSLNHTLAHNSDKGMFVSFLWALFDFAKCTVTLVHAGHLPLLHWQSRSRQVCEHTTSGVALGLTPNASFQAKAITFEQEDLFLFYTDGVTETANAVGGGIRPATIGGADETARPCRFCQGTL